MVWDGFDALSGSGAGDPPKPPNPFKKFVGREGEHEAEIVANALHYTEGQKNKYRILIFQGLRLLGDLNR